MKGMNSEFCAGIFRVNTVRVLFTFMKLNLDKALFSGSERTSHPTVLPAFLTQLFDSLSALQDWDFKK